MLRSTIKDTFRDSLWYGVSQFLSRAGGFVLLPLYAMWFEPSQFGVVQSLTVVLSGIYTVVEMEIVSSANRLYHEYRSLQQEGQLIGTHVAILSVSMILVGGLVYGVATIYGFSNLSLENANAPLIIGTIGVFFWALSDYCFAILRLKGHARMHLYVTLIQLVILVAANVITVGFMGLGVQGVFISLLITYVVTFMVLAPRVLHKNNLSISFSLIRRTLGYCSPLLVLAVLEWIRVYYYQLYIAHEFGQSELGLIAVGQKIVHVYMIVAAAFQMAWTPRLMKHVGRPEAKQLCVHYYRYSLVLFMVMACAISIYAKEIIIIIAPAAYLHAYKYVVPLFIVAFGGVLAIYYGNGIMISEKTVYYPLGYLIGVIVGVPLIIAGGNVFGIYGTLIGAGLFSLMLAFITLFMANRVYRVSYSFYPLLFVVGSMVCLGIYNYIDVNEGIAKIPFLAKTMVLSLLIGMVYRLWLTEEERSHIRLGLKTTYLSRLMRSSSFQ